jgi:hypothetical protein
MMPVFSRISLMAALCFLASCSGGGVNSNIIGQVREPISWRQVTIVGVEPKGFLPIADLQASSRNSMAFSNSDKIDAALVRLKKAAAGLGANTLLLGDAFERSPTALSSVTRKSLGFIPQNNRVGSTIVDALSPDAFDHSLSAKAGFISVDESSP